MHVLPVSSVPADQKINVAKTVAFVSLRMVRRIIISQIVLALVVRQCYRVCAGIHTYGH